MTVLSHTIALPRSPADVWAHLVDLPAWRRWNTVWLDAPEGLAVGRPVRLSIALPRGRLPASARLVAVEAARELRWRGGVPGLFVGVHGFRLEPDGDGTRLVHDEVFTGLLVRPILAFLGVDAARYREVNEAFARDLAGAARAAGSAG